ncbi:MAG: hypothetical protein GX348_02060 [Veillonellaceae bacterium]|nr:hypothetical protein [Veillonellaceae bacterium]
MNEEKQLSITEPHFTWNRKKIGLIILAVVFLVGIILFQFAADKVRQEAEQSLLTGASEAVNGQVIVGGIDLSILGYVVAKDVQVLDTGGKTLARIERVQINYSWSNLLKGELGPQLIKGVTVDKPELWLAYRQNKLNWDGLLKTKTDEQSDFSGLVKVQNGTLHLESDFFEKTVEQLSGTLDFRQANQLGLSATGKLNNATLSLDGQWGTQGPSEITLSATGMDLVALGLTVTDDPIQLTDGNLDEITVKIGKDTTSGTILLKTLAGRFSGVNTAGALALTQGSAQFEKQGDTIQIKNGQAMYKGQTITAAGHVLTAADGEKTLDFTVEMPSGNPAALLPGLPAGGVLAAQGKVTGSVLSPVLAGSFNLSSLQFDNMIISGINGTFSYAQQTLKLLTADGATIGGTIAANGDIYPDSEQFALSISGSGLDSSQLTTKDVKGPLSLTGTAAGSATAPIIQGSFTIYDGKAYGIAFKTLTGSFIKRGSAEAEVSELVVKTDFGVFYPEQLSQSVMEKLQERNLPTSRAEVKEQVKEQVTEKVKEKMREKLFR